ncbi:MAG: carotenoid 1,2-hydratase [Gammaproteobacteria bacterium]|nr:hypothetical protein [Pseudomonadales bacterium]MCP5347015.1 carotenoid 1,2-hydratase [Pseudomonadales bacterium]
MNHQPFEKFPHFDQPVAANGYAWWYVDAVSDDGSEALTLIAFVGSVFSPYYARARRRAPADPMEHCAINAVFYSRRGKRWAMTERPGRAVHRSAHSLEIGPSSVVWDGSSLIFQLDELTVPLPTRLRGQVRIWPTAVTLNEFALDRHGQHHWRPIAPCARVEVNLSHPRRQWSGQGYWDSNIGTRPLEQDFDSWNWSRASQAEGAVILYEGSYRDTGCFSLALNADRDGNLTPFTPPAPATLAATRWWRIARQTRADGGAAEVVSTLEDTPFYSRSLLTKSLLNRPVTMVHESLSMTRFRSAWVPRLLPFRMPRAGFSSRPGKLVKPESFRSRVR